MYAHRSHSVSGNQTEVDPRPAPPTARFSDRPPASVYPFDRWTEDEGVSEAEKMRRMLERMTSQGFRLHPEVALSAEGVEVLRGLLMPRPEERLRVADVLTHPWFLKNLPPMAMDMQKWYVKLGSARGDVAMHR